MHRAALVVLLGTGLASALAISLASGCAVSASASSQSGSRAEGASGAGGGGEGRPAQHNAADGAADGAGQPGAPAPAACVPQLNDLATSLFNGRVVIHLPKGLELVEQNGFYAQLAAPNQATSCGAPVRYAAVGFFQQPAADINQVRDTLLELRGIPGDTVTWSEEGARGRNFTGAYSAAQDPKTGAPPTRGWMVLREAPNDKYAYFALFETDEANWEALKGVFAESGRRLLVKPRALQGPDQVAPAPAPEPKKPASKKTAKSP